MSKNKENKTIGIAKKGWTYSTSIITVIFWALIAAVLFVDSVKGHYAVLKTVGVVILLIAVFAVLLILLKNNKPKE